MKTTSKTMRILALILSLCLVFSLTAFAADDPAAGPGGPPGGPGGPPGGPGGAATPTLTFSTDFKDIDKVTFKDELGLLVQLGIINGVQEDDSFFFKPEAKLSRAEMAKIIAAAVTAISGEKPTGKATFTDVAEGYWAKDYIAFGYDKKYVDGVGGGAFDPLGEVTGYQTAKLLLAAMGVEGLTGAEWKAKTIAAGTAEKLFDGLEKVDLDKAITRGDAVRLIYNALLKSDGSKALPGVTVVSKSGKLDSLEIKANQLITGLEKELLTYVSSEGQEFAPETGTVYTNVNVYVTPNYGQIGSFGGGDKPDDYRFRAGLYVDEKGVDADKSVVATLKGGSYDKSGMKGVTITSTSDSFNGIIINGKVEYVIEDCVFVFDTKSDGSDVNDFSGYGAVVAAYNGAKVTIKNCVFKTTGVAKLASFCDEYAHVIWDNSKYEVNGGTLYEGYKNSANQATMVAPPWVLGITGNARGTNLEGNCSSTILIGTEAVADQWGVVSTDAGSDMLLYMVDSTLTLSGKGQKDPFSEKYGSGYGTYAIGSAQEFFYGCTLNVGTYATIFTGGYATYASSNFEGGKTSVYPLDTTVAKYDFLGRQLTGFGATPVVSDIAGKGQITTINSDAFGFMCHGSAGIKVTDGTVVNTDNATFLLKVGDIDIDVSDGAKINTEDGVILQMMDNDDSLVGMGDMSTMSFNTKYHEDAGWHSGEAGKDSADGGRPVDFTATDVALVGDLYNGSGNYFVTGMGGGGSYSGNALNITLGSGATLKGAIAPTAVMHVDENGNQKTDFTIKEYYYLGHMANKVNYNGANKVNVTLKDGAVWTVDGDSLVTTLVIGEGCSVVVPAGYKVTVDGKDVTELTAGTYANVAFTKAA